VISEGSDSSYSRWLKIQIWLAVSGMVAWLAGAGTGNSFIAGVGTGIMASALVLRFVRGKSPDGKSGGDGA
jgi:uncharacterized membrane protein YjjP (DUF1212 family)